MKGPSIPPVFRVFRTKEPREFGYVPRYYDEEKERMQERYRRIQQEVEDARNAGQEVRHEHLRDRMDHSWRGEYARQSQQANIRLLIILVLLCLICYIIFAYLGAVVPGTA